MPESDAERRARWYREWVAVMTSGAVANGDQ